MATVNLRITRTPAWVAQQRLETGDNVPEHIVRPVDVAQLSLESRRVLLECGGGSYSTSSEAFLSFDSNYKPICGSYFGRCDVIVDSYEPTVEQIDAAIQAAMAKLAAMRAEQEQRQRAFEAEKAERERARAAQAAAIAQARELLSDELDRLRHYEQDRRTLGEFLAAVPADALRGTLRSVATSDDTIAALKKKIEDATPVCVFNKFDNDESDDESDE